MSDAEKQLIAQLDWIDKMAGIYTTAHRATHTLERNDFDFEALELIGDLDWNVGDGAEALADAADQALRDNALEIEYEARWSAGYEPQAQKIIATLCLGGPTVRISTSLDHHGNAIADETEGHFSWGVDSGTVMSPPTTTKPSNSSALVALRRLLRAKQPPPKCGGFFMSTMEICSVGAYPCGKNGDRVRDCRTIQK